MFGFADVTMGLLALVNLVALALLYKVGKRLMHDYDDQVKAGIENPVFDARKFADLDLDHRAWSTDKATDANGADTAAGLAHSHR
ncbi:Amino-acid carrier protein AlsT [compost metagenome]